MNTHVRDNMIDLDTRANVGYVPNRVLAYHSTTQNAIDNAWTGVNFDSELFDSNGMHDNATNRERLTCKSAGLYMVWGCCEFDAYNINSRWIAIRLNGSSFRSEEMFPSTISIAHPMSIVALVQLAVNDYVELMAKQNSNTTRVINTSANYSPYFGMVQLSS